MTAQHNYPSKVLTLPAASRRRGRWDSYYSKRNFHAGVSHGSPEHCKPAWEHYLNHLDMTFYVVLPTDKHTRSIDEEIAFLGQLLENAVLVKFEPDRFEETHIHIFPLLAWPAVMSWYASEKNDLDLEKYPENGMEAVYVSGRPYAFATACAACKNYMEKALGLCKPLHPSCRKLTYPFDFDELLFSPPSKQDELRTEFEKEHPCHIERLKALPGYAQRKMGQISIHDDFYHASLNTLTVDEDEHLKEFERRSEKSSQGAGVRRLKRLACGSCVIHYRYDIQSCQRRPNNYEYGCLGPVKDADLTWLAELCEPWMLHVIFLRSINLRGRWDGTRYLRFTEYEPGFADNTAHCTWSLPEHSKSTRMVNCYRWSARRDFIGTTVNIPYETLCELTKAPVYDNWEQFRTFKYGDPITRTGWPVSPLLRAVIVCAYKGWLDRFHNTGGWGSSTELKLIDIDMEGNDCVRLRYACDRGWTCNREIKSFHDLYHADAMHDARRKLIKVDEARRRLASRYLRYVFEHHMAIPAEAWLALVREHPDWLDENAALPEPADLDKMVKATCKALNIPGQSAKPWKPLAERKPRLAMHRPYPADTGDDEKEE